MGRENMLQRALRRLATSNAELESEELQRNVRDEGAIPIGTCEDRQQVCLTGTISSITLSPRAGHPALEVELRDGSGGGHARVAGTPADPGHRRRPDPQGPGPDQLPRGSPAGLQPPLRAAAHPDRFVTEADRVGPADAAGVEPAPAGRPQFRYVEELVRYELSRTLGGVRGMVEAALPFIAFTVAWVSSRALYLSLGVALGTALVLAVVRLAQRSSLKFVAQAVIPTAIAALIATRTGRAEDVFLPGILYNGALAVVSLLTVAVRRPLVGLIVGAALENPTGWIRDRALVKMSTRLTLVLAVPYVLRFVVQLPLFLAGQVVWLAVAKVVLGWPLLLGALFVIGLLLSRGRTPIEESDS